MYDRTKCCGQQPKIGHICAKFNESKKSKSFGFIALQMLFARWWSILCIIFANEHMRSDIFVRSLLNKVWVSTIQLWDQQVKNMKHSNIMESVFRCFGRLSIYACNWFTENNAFFIPLYTRLIQFCIFRFVFKRCIEIKAIAVAMNQNNILINH